jgi:hypothetical protein
MYFLNIMSATDKILIVGCSFISNLQPAPGHPIPEDYPINLDRFVLRGASGAGNQSMAARVMYECTQQKYSKVIVLWSGVNRIDVPIGIALHNVLPKNKNGFPLYPYYTRIDNMVWYHSGGYRMSGTTDSCPKFLQTFFDNQYRSADQRYLSNLTLLSIIQTQSFLKAQNMPFEMSFIYDTNGKYDNTVGPACGPLELDSPLSTMVDWNSFTAKVPPYEYAVNQPNGLQDGFHPTNEVMMNWFKEHLDIDLKQTVC